MIVFLLLLNLLIAMMGDTYAKVDTNLISFLFGRTLFKCNVLVKLFPFPDCSNQERVDEAVGKDFAHY